MKDLPEIFKNKLDDDLNNNKEFFRSNSVHDEDINSILKSIPVTVYIETNTKEMTTTIIGRTENYIITKMREVIYINDIKTIKRL